MRGTNCSGMGWCSTVLKITLEMWKCLNYLQKLKSLGFQGFLFGLAAVDSDWLYRTCKQTAQETLVFATLRKKKKKKNQYFLA